MRALLNYDVGCLLLAETNTQVRKAKQTRQPTNKQTRKTNKAKENKKKNEMEA